MSGDKTSSVKKMLVLSTFLVLSVLLSDLVLGQTTVRLKDTENMVDVRITDANNTYNGQIKYNISGAVPPGQTITNATQCFWAFEFYPSGSCPVHEYIDVWRVDDQVWNSSSSAAQLAAAPTTNSSTQKLNQTAENVDWWCFDVTNIVKTDYDVGNMNTTIRFEDYAYDIISFSSVNYASEVKFGNYPEADIKFNSEEDPAGNGNTPELIIVYEAAPSPPPGETFDISYQGVTQYDVANASRYSGATITFEANVTDSTTTVKEVHIIIDDTIYNLTGTNSSVWEYSYAIDLGVGDYNMTWYMTNYTDEYQTEFGYQILPSTLDFQFNINGQIATGDFVPSNYSIAYETSMPQPTYLAETGFSYGQYVYVLGGVVGGVNSELMRRYDTVSDTWSYMANFSTGIREVGGAVIDDKIYVLGGENTTDQSATIWVYNISNDAWYLENATLPEKKAGMTNGCPYNGAIFQFGGKNELGQSSNRVIRYNTTTGVVEYMPNMTHDIRDQAVICDGNYAYIIGGYRDPPVDDDLETTYRYNMANDTWTSMANLSYDVREVSGGLLNGDQIFILGGTNSSVEPQSRISIYNISDDVWYDADFDLLTPVRLSASETVGDSIYLMGGFDASTDVVQVVTYNPGYDDTYVSVANISSINLTVWTNVTGLQVSFTSNFTGWSSSSGTSPYENTTEAVYQTYGIYNFTAWYSDTNPNYTEPASSPITYNVNVYDNRTAANVSVYPVTQTIVWGQEVLQYCDKDIPSYGCFIYRYDCIDAGTCENETLVTNGTSIGLSAGYYKYIGNISDYENYTAYTDTQYLNVTRLEGQVSVFPANTSESYGYSPTIYCTSNSPVTCYVYENETLVANGTSRLLPVGGWTYKANISSNQNITAAENISYVYISQAPVNLDIYTSPSSPITYETQSNITCIASSPEGSASLYRNGTNVTATENNTLFTLPAGTWNYTCKVDNIENYTSNSSTVWYTVSQKDANVQVYPSGTITYEDGASLQYCTDDSDLLDCALFRDDVSIPNSTSLELAAGSYDYVANITDIQNYTNWNDTETFTVNQKDAAVTVSPATGSQTYPYTITQDCSDSSSYYDCILYREAVQITKSTSYSPGAGVYNYSAEIVEDKVNYTNTEDNGTLTINKAQLDANLYINGQLNQDVIVSDGVVNATAQCSNVNGLPAYLYRDGVYKGDNEQVVLFEGTYNYTANCTGNANYTSDAVGETWSAIVTEAPQVIIYTPANDTTYGLLPIDDKYIDLLYVVNNQTSPAECWYSLDGLSNVSLSDCQNSTMSFQTSGAGDHYVTVYSNETVGGNVNSTTNYFTIEFTSTWNVTGPDGIQLTSGNARVYNSSYEYLTSTTDGQIKVNTSDLPYGNFTIDMEFPGYTHSGTTYLDRDNSTQINTTLSIGFSGLLIRVFDENSLAPIPWYKLSMINSTTNASGYVETQLGVGRGLSLNDPQPLFLDGNEFTYIENTGANYTYQYGFVYANFSMKYDITSAGSSTNNISIEAWDATALAWVPVYNITNSGNAADTVYFTVNNTEGRYEDLYSLCLQGLYYCPLFKITMDDDGTASIKVYEITLEYPYQYDTDGFSDVNYTDFQLTTGTSRFIFSSPVYSGATASNNYLQRTYLVSPTSYQSTSLDAYLNGRCFIQQFLILDVSNEEPIEDVTMTVYRQYGSESKIIAQERSDTSGRADICVQPGYPYVVAFTHSTYDSQIFYDKIWTVGAGVETILMSQATTSNITNPYNVYLNITPYVTEYRNASINQTCLAIMGETGNDNLELESIFAYFKVWYKYPYVDDYVDADLSNYPPIYNASKLPFNITGTSGSNYTLIYNYNSSVYPGSLWEVELSLIGDYVLECGLNYSYTEESIVSWSGDAETGYLRWFSSSLRNGTAGPIIRQVRIYKDVIAPAGRSLTGMISGNGIYIVLLFIDMMVTSFFITKFGMRSAFLFLVLWALMVSIVGGWGIENAIYDSSGNLVVGGLLTNVPFMVLTIGTMVWLIAILYPFRRGR